jgi:RNA-directed DNA polymerase
VARILERTPDGPGRGLPIGALTSQHFANTYLAGFDRFLLEACGVRGLVRYMDDVVFWCDTRERAREVLLAATSYLAQERGLALKPDALVGRSEHGLPFLGFRILRGALRLSLRRKRRFTAARARSERAFLEGRTTALELQAGYASALAITAHADASGFLRAELLRRPSPVEALC